MMTFKKMLAAVTLAMLVAGCGGSVGDVTGKVTYKDKPVTSGTVVVLGKDGIPKSGSIQPDGSYRVVGVKSGEARVMVSSPPLVAVAGSVKDGAKAEASDKPSLSQEAPAPAANPELTKTWVAIPEKYGDTTKTDLKLTVVSGANAFDIPLN